MRNLILLRGLPGCGKSTIAHFLEAASTAPLCIRQICADDCWPKPYTAETFTKEGHAKAHKKCLEIVIGWMREGTQDTIVVHNTFTTKEEMLPYEGLAAKLGYRLHTLVVENRHGSKSKHDVPVEILTKMARRFEVHL